MSFVRTPFTRVMQSILENGSNALVTVASGDRVSMRYALRPDGGGYCIDYFDPHTPTGDLESWVAYWHTSGFRVVRCVPWGVVLPPPSTHPIPALPDSTGRRALMALARNCAELWEYRHPRLRPVDREWITKEAPRLVTRIGIRQECEDAAQEVARVRGLALSVDHPGYDPMG